MSQHNYKHHSNKSLWIVLISIGIIFLILFGLNSYLENKNKNNAEVLNNISNDYSLMGDINAKVKLIEFSDFECPACKIYAEIVKKLYFDINKEYGSSSLAIYYKHFPLVQIHRNALISSQSAEAAGLQGKFWEMHDILFEKQEEWGNSLQAKSIIENYAKELGLDMEKFKLDRDSENIKNKISDSYKDGIKIDIKGTPTFFLNGVLVENPDGYEGLKKQILEKLKN